MCDKQTLAAAVLAAVAASLPCGAIAQEAGDREEASRLVVLAGADTLAVEDFAWGDGMLESDLGDRTIDKRFRFTVAFGENLVPTSFDADMWELSDDPGSPASIRSSLEFVGDSVFAEVIGAQTPEFQRIGTQQGAVPFLNLSFAVVEHAIRLRRLEGGDGEVPFFLWANGQTLRAQVAFGGTDAATMTLGGVVLELTVDESGRVLGGSVPAQGLTIVRVH